MNLTSKAVWFRKRALMGLAIIGSLAMVLCLVFSETEPDRNMAIKIGGFFGTFALTFIQAQYLCISALHAWLSGNIRAAVGRLIGVLILFCAAYFLIDLAAAFLPSTNQNI
ncbi:hypothetical protein HMJ29_06925 [Hymenobacter taeanensis]|uniref:Uncharacterized protein n=1 Tax=Hymenobacter taeanensis TaxID=2735321 RepID=A0A6M6BI03_9BACT|nr:MULTISPECIES: hypothetical protein [Hymenobacter]QJX46685.1 hypothetical protein HMJ29_06925 [Hymenobacter taeanensis]UOQ80550.1 hypothetical protein MUN83_17270 [Hymenobacter sp. 5414T-23]